MFGRRAAEPKIVIFSVVAKLVVPGVVALDLKHKHGSVSVFDYPLRQSFFCRPRADVGKRYLFLRRGSVSREAVIEKRAARGLTFKVMTLVKKGKIGVFRVFKSSLSDVRQTKSRNAFQNDIFARNVGYRSIHAKRRRTFIGFYRGHDLNLVAFLSDKKRITLDFARNVL